MLGIEQRTLNYGDVHATRPETAAWDPPVGYRSSDATVLVGTGPACWLAACAAVLSWEVKTRSGFTVRPVANGRASVEVGQRYWLRAPIGPVRILEPVEVVAVVDSDVRCGFAYGTLSGHPVTGEEAFIVHRDAEGAVSLTVRSFTRPGSGWWRPAYPAALMAQRLFRRRYVRALGGEATGLPRDN